MLDIAKDVCNDLNRILTVNIVGLIIAHMMNHRVDLNNWQTATLRDIGVITVYDHVLVKFHKNFRDTGLVGDIFKTISLMLLPNIFRIDSNLINRTIIVVMGIVFYHRVIRPPLAAYMKRKGVRFNSAVEELVENLVLLSLSKNTSTDSLTTQIFGVIIYHMYFTC